MKKLFRILCFLIFSMILFTNCADMSWDKPKKNRTDRSDDDRSRRRDRDKSANEPPELNELSGPNHECEGDDYIIYAKEDCDTFKTTNNSNNNDDNYGQSFSVPGLSGPKPPVDILFVLDTNDDMYLFFSNILQKRFKKFMSIIHPALDWQWFYTNTDYEVEDPGWFMSMFTRDGNNGKALHLESDDRVLDKHVLTPSDDQYEDIFLNSISAQPYKGHVCDYPPYCQDEDSHPLSALKAALSANKPLTRKEAMLAVVLITNTDEYPDDDDHDHDYDDDSADFSESSSDTATTAKQVIKEFQKVYGTSKKLLVFNIIILPEDKQCLKKVKQEQPFVFSSAHEGKKIAQLAKEAGGGNFSICLKDYSQVAHSLVHLATEGRVSQGSPAPTSENSVIKASSQLEPEAN